MFAAILALICLMQEQVSAEAVMILTERQVYPAFPMAAMDCCPDCSCTYLTILDDSLF